MEISYLHMLLNKTENILWQHYKEQQPTCKLLVLPMKFRLVFSLVYPFIGSRPFLFKLDINLSSWHFNFLSCECSHEIHVPHICFLHNPQYFNLKNIRHNPYWAIMFTCICSCCVTTDSNFLSFTAIVFLEITVRHD